MNFDQWIALSKGALTYVPYAHAALARRRTGGTDMAGYCYGVWLKHLTLLSEVGCLDVPDTVVEIGPGDSIGTGIAALFSGASRYLGVDAYPYASSDRNARIASALLQLFHERMALPSTGWPDFSRHLDGSGFPSGMLSDTRLHEALSPARVTSILGETAKPGTRGAPGMVNYRAPWDEQGIIDPDSVDFLFSHSVLEHVADLPFIMRMAYRWLKPGGLMSHQFDLQSHGITRAWDGHRAFDERTWHIVVGRRPFLINRLPYSAILHAIQDVGFEILTERRQSSVPTLPRSALRRPWAAFSDDDIQTIGGFVQARKPAPAVACRSPSS